MSTPKTIYVIGGSRAGLVRALTLEFEHRVSVLHSISVPVRTLGRMDIAVVDLEGISLGVDPASLLPFLQNHRIWLLSGESPIRGAWMGLVCHTHVKVISCTPNERVAGFMKTRALFHEYLEGPHPSVIVDSIVQHNPQFAALRAIILAICAHPWEISHPHQLAEALGISKAHMVTELRAAGFTRVEHFITLVRVTALDLLVSRHGLPPIVARRLVGVEDTSNLRRQIVRARESAAFHPS